MSSVNYKEDKSLPTPRKKRISTRLIKSACRIIGTVFIAILAIWFTVSQPSCRQNSRASSQVDPERLRKHVETLAETYRPRSWTNIENLNLCARYIAHEFTLAGADVELQPVQVHGKIYHNVIGRFGKGKPHRVVLGAHYDAYDELPAANDNASSVAALIEIASLFGTSASNAAVDLVAYVLEEPPFFRTDNMGSFVHAAYISDSKHDIQGVIVMDMIGRFSDKPGSQTYPSTLLRLIYPDRANFIAVVSRWDQGDWIKKIKIGMKGATDLPVRSMRAPSAIPGIDFSDHMNYWPHGIKAAMITDTAFYRDSSYHTGSDTPDKLDYNRMAAVTVSAFEAVLHIQNHYSDKPQEN